MSAPAQQVCLLQTAGAVGRAEERQALKILGKQTRTESEMPDMYNITFKIVQYLQHNITNVI